MRWFEDYEGLRITKDFVTLFFKCFYLTFHKTDKI